ncbi:chorismate mutase / prephenate dehydratase [Pseudobutyrivibrio sp. UC1225]|uniref:prephenate dehydratase n=1 Tax=Pseudobutyrivibrio sp. UC1225 TaxID=1798185 RepID=UPI0008E3FBE3|nr:prephenate dehydratase [Pseudobutyrivibrio sp. UC1225]SFN46455.1 chorismate mutase / prephenate dehydratase [Pseudobutyrivibrio sp. UC1225]
MRDLNDIRVEIDQVDKEILNLFTHRMELACQVAEYKIATGKKVYDKVREDEKLEKLSSYVEDGFSQQAVKELYTQIMSISRKKQFSILRANGINFDSGFQQVDDFDFSEATVCFQGVQGAYSQLAMLAFFDDEMKSSFHVDLWRDAMDAISSGEADYAVLPIENSLAGSIEENFDLLSEYNVAIIGEQILKVDHALLGVKGAKISDIKTVYSHPKAIAQCDEYIRTKHIDWDVKNLRNTAMSAQKIKDDGDITQAAIGSTYNAFLYDLDILEEAIQDDKNNETRFVIVSKDKKYRKNADKISLCLEISHTPGSLYRILSNLMFNGINMNRIESRPIKGVNWQYRFFIDIDGNLNDEAVRNALTGLKEECVSLRVLGNY